MPPPSMKNRRKFGSTTTTKQSKVEPEEFDLEKARQEVFNLGIKGLSFKDKRTAKRQLAIRLGAIPKKPRGKNIKQHLEEIRERKRQEKEQREEQSLRINMDGVSKSKSKANSKKPKKKGLNEVRRMDYQLGRFKNGIQYLSKKDLERIKIKK